jgi:hypothetical protein
MELRETCIEVIKGIIKDNKEQLGVVTCKRAPTNSITSSITPAIIIIEGDDVVLKKTSRGIKIYPVKRNLELILEIITVLGYDIKKLYRHVRSVVLQNPIVADDCYIEEIRAEGPHGYELPDVKGMRLVLSLMYTDNG